MSQRPGPEVTDESGRTAASGDRFPSLDGFRALAMLSVFLFHAWLPIPRLIFTKLHLLPGVVWHGNSVIANLNIGVAMFFGLSGFVIYRPFVAAHIGRRGAPDVISYARRRALRIYPAYWLVFSVLLASGEFVHLTRAQLIANLALVQTWFSSTANTGIGQAWTLVVEVAFYAFVPVWAGLVRYFARDRDPVRIRAGRRDPAHVGGIRDVVVGCEYQPAALGCDLSSPLDGARSGHAAGDHQRAGSP